MIIKSDFVTNSSSTAYIIIDMNKPHLNLVESLDNWNAKVDPSLYHFFEVIEYKDFTPCEIEELKVYNNFNNPIDWISEIMGKCNQLGSREVYIKSLKALKDGKTVHHLVIDDQCNGITDFIDSSKNLEIIYCKNC